MRKILYIGTHHPVPFRFVQFLDRACGGDSGIIHQDIQPSEMLQNACYRRFNLCFAGYIALKRKHPAALGFNLLPRRFQPVRSYIQQGNIRPLSGQSLGQFCAYPPAAPVTTATFPLKSNGFLTGTPPSIPPVPT